MDGVRIRKASGQVALGVIAIGVVTVICFRLHANSAIPAFLYLLIVVLPAQARGFASSAIVSLVAVLCLDYFFTPPILQLEIASPTDAITLCTYLITSLIITRLATEAQAKARSAEARRAALQRLYEVVWRLFSIDPPRVSSAGILQIYREVLDLESVCLFDAVADKIEIAGTPRHRLVKETRTAYELGQDIKNRPSEVWIERLHVAGRPIGAIGFQGLSDADSMAAPLSMLAGAALERAESFRTASSAAATSQVETLRTAIVDALAHQFKTPLAAILTAAGGIREARDLTTPQLDMIEMIETETVRLSRLTTRLLVTARLDRDEVQPRLEPTNLVGLIARIIDQCPPERHVFMNSSSAPIEVASDQELLSLVLTQLVDNAFRYSRPNTAVQIIVESKESWAFVRVTNQSTPIASGERERIFERFYRGAATNRLVPGAGLGLYVARKIALAHEGGLHLEENPAGKSGNTFCLKLPIWKSTAHHVRQAS
jgi:two-component system sensor histidine kinase KdpD